MRLLALLVASAALAGCAGSSAPTPAAVAAAASPAASTPPASPLTTSPTPTRTVTASPAPTPTAPRVARPRYAAPAFRTSVARVTAAQLGKSWHRGCPTPPSSLRALTMTTWGFDNRAHTGTLVVNASAVTAVSGAFRRIYAARFPIRKMVPIAAYGGSDDASMADDNTSAFNCRAAVSNGPKTWSMHAYGLAVDINTLENPYTLDGRVYPPAGKPYTDRSRYRRGMITPGTSPVRAFSAVGWGWGGRWSSSPDYQHFSSNGK